VSDAFNRAARMAYAFAAMNWAVLAGLFRLVGRRRVWK
jgi:hypothetical protein